MFNDVIDNMFINQPFSLLECVHQALLTDPVNHSRNPRRALVDRMLINCRYQCFEEVYQKKYENYIGNDGSAKKHTVE